VNEAAQANFANGVEVDIGKMTNYADLEIKGNFVRNGLEREAWNLRVDRLQDSPLAHDLTRASQEVNEMSWLWNILDGWLVLI
jgi:hypothetical protein